MCDEEYQTGQKTGHGQSFEYDRRLLAGIVTVIERHEIFGKFEAF